MVKITFVEAGGESHTVEAEQGASVMRTAVRHAIPSIIGECGGSCVCATCHVRVDAEWVGTVGPAGEDEDMTLEFVPDRAETSRLGCQIALTDELDGLVVHLPESQG
jgi:2Fe-2S ferredoxin